IRKYWTSDVISHHGRWIRFEEVHTAPRPLRTPHPPIWVGGSSEAAMRRAVQYGNAWHPNRFRMEWLEDEGLPAVRRIAEEEGKPVPALCPRLRIQTPDKARADIETLSRLGATHVLFDTYAGQPESTLHPEKDWEMLIRILGPLKNTNDRRRLDYDK